MIISWQKLGRLQTPTLLPLLFPQPIKVEQCDDGEDVSIPSFSLMIHQLAAWGRAVRNCVGGGHGYSDGIKKMKHLIILTMIDNKPRYKIQLTVNNGVIRVDQIADIGNRYRLTALERSDIESAFNTALHQREAQLQQIKTKGVY